MGNQGEHAGRELDAAWLRAAVCREGGLWADVAVVAETGSTNADLLSLAREGAPEGAPEGLVLVAEAQSAGRGRLGRQWITAPGSALAFSVLLRPARVPVLARGWVPLLAGVAVATAVRELAGLRASLKWPNDVLVGDGKLSGILAEQAAGAIVVGIGLNMAGGEGDLPVPTATSLAAHGAGDVGRGELLAAILSGIESWYVPWCERSGDADASGLREAYLGLCATVGRRVRVSLPGDRSITGTATGVDAAGRLLVAPEGAPAVAVSAGDVVHVR